MSDQESGSFGDLIAYAVIAVPLLAAVWLTDSDTVTIVAMVVGAIGIGIGLYYLLRAFWIWTNMD